jgi:hypothetical protein
MPDIGRLTVSRKGSAIAAVGAVVAAAIAAAVLATGSGSAPPPSLTTVSPRFLEGIELRLDSPEVDSPPVSREQAEATARRDWPGREPRESVLAQCEGPQISLTCWVVSLPPDGITSMGTPSKPGSALRAAKYLIVLVDANTGQVITSYTGT